MSRRVLITGGAGFIGSHVADELLEHGYAVRALDNLSEQVHERPDRPPYLASDVELIVGDVRDRAAVRRALENVDSVLHLAAAVGVGQSMYRIAEYVSANDLGTAVLLEEVAERRPSRLVVASSMSVYGEGRYETADGRSLDEVERHLDDLRRGRWEPMLDGQELVPVPTPEVKRPALSSVYALTKYDQERMCLLVGRAYGVPTLALRFFNVYGPRQAVSNPYTGVLAIFASRLLSGERPIVFEDGKQKRDFVSVHDVARACRLAIESDANGQAVNIGSGRSIDVNEIGERLAAVLGKPSVTPSVSGRYRVGDIRHCFSDISLAKSLLGYEPTVALEDGMAELARWLETQSAADRTRQAHEELATRGLTI